MGTSSQAAESRPEMVAAVLETLHRQPRMHVVELSDAIGADPTTVDRVCFQLQRDGYVRARGGGDYSITARGERRLRRL
jgi:DNA-binding IclR family transcriptional regulator